MPLGCSLRFRLPPAQLLPSFRPPPRLQRTCEHGGGYRCTTKRRARAAAAAGALAFFLWQWVLSHYWAVE